MSWTQEAVLARGHKRVAQALDRERILVPHVDVALHRAVVGADGVGRDDHTLDHRMRVAFEHRTVHERAGVALVGVADDVVLVTGVLAARTPLSAGGEACAAAAAQAALVDLVDYGQRIGGLEHLGQRRIPAVGDVVVQRVGVDLAVEAEHYALLPGVEGDVLLQGYRLAGLGMLVQQSLDHSVAHDAGLDELVDIRGLEPGIEQPAGPEDDDGALLAEAVAAGLDHLDLVGQAALLQRLR